MLVWRCQRFLAKGHLPRVSRQSRRSLMIRVIMKWSWELCTDLLAFALQLRKTCETCCPWSHGLRPKKLSVSASVPPAPVRVPNQRPLAPCVASVTSVANDKDDNEMILGAVDSSPGICLTAEEYPRKPLLGDRNRLKWGPFLQNELGRNAQHVRKGERRK